MATYTVWVQLPELGQRVTLTRTEDQDAATALISALVGAASGVTLDVGCQIDDVTVTPARKGEDGYEPAKGETAQTQQPPHGAATSRHGPTARPKG